MAVLVRFELIFNESSRKRPLTHSKTYAMVFSFMHFTRYFATAMRCDHWSALAIFRDPSQIAITQKYKLLSMFCVKTTQWNGLSLCLTPMTMFLVSYVQFNSILILRSCTLVTSTQGDCSVAVAVIVVIFIVWGWINNKSSTSIHWIRYKFNWIAYTLLQQPYHSEYSLKLDMH